MSKSLKKLIDINRLREFKNKIVGADSAYVQTTAVDQTIAGTKTFSQPIVGSVTGSSGSCTGNAATATTATGNANGKELTNTIIKGLSISGKTITYTQIDGNTGTLTTQDTVYTHPTTAGNKHIPSGGSSGQFLGWASDGTAKWVNNPNTNTDTLMTQNVSTTNATYPVLLVATANATANQGAKTGIFAKSVKVNPSTNVISASGFSGPLTGNVTGNCSGSSGSCTGNAATATTAANGVDSAGGDWIRFKNGIQICTGKTPSIHLDAGEAKTVSTNFPKSFSNKPDVIVCSANPHIIAATWGISKTGCDAYLKSTSPGDGTNFGRYIAFGTWK